MERVEAPEHSRIVGWIFTAVFFALVTCATLYLVGISTGRVGFDPESPSGSGDLLSWFAYLAIIFGGLLYMVASGTRAMSAELATPGLPLVGLAAVAYAGACFYSYDDYRLPELVHRSAVSNLPHWSLAALAVGAVAAGLVALRGPRTALFVQGLFLWTVAVWIFLIGPFY